MDTGGGVGGGGGGTYLPSLLLVGVGGCDSVTRNKDFFFGLKT